MKSYKYIVMDKDLNIYLRTDSQESSELYIKEWAGIGPKLYLVDSAETENFIKQSVALPIEGADNA